MASGYDFAIFGGGRLAALLCGLLTHRHGKQVLRIADPVPRQRLPRAVDVALPLSARPASWWLVRAATAETMGLLAEIEGQDRLDRVDVKLVADLPATTTALAHLIHIAAGYGIPSRDGVFRGIPRLSGEVDLTHSSVQTIETARAVLKTEQGAAKLLLDGEAVGVGQIVLADDDAILERLPEAEWPAQLAAEVAMATLTAPARTLPVRVMRYLDRGVVLMQREDRAILALVAGQVEAEARLGSCFNGVLPLQRRATTHYRRLVTRDGAPLIGRLASSNLIVVAGSGSAGAFLAPPLARLLAGVPTDDEETLFAAHDPARTNRAPVADIAEARP